MGLFNRKKTENRASGEVEFDDALLQALLSTAEITKEVALQIPTVSGGIDLIANVVAGTPIKLYRDRDGKAEEIRDDYRLRLLNDETGDTLSANEFWHAMIRDYFVGKGGYAYLNRVKGKVKSIHYVDEGRLSLMKNADPIFKDFKIQVNGSEYEPYQFLKILRNTRDGAEGIPITMENSRLIRTAYQQMQLEYIMAKRGGQKKGVLQTEGKADKEQIDSLRAAWSSVYNENSDNVVVLNKGLKFQETSDTAAEMQMNESKALNASEFAKIFHVSTDVISGKAADITGLAKLAAIPLMTVIQCALNRDLLLEREKGNLYFAFDTKELLKGEMKERFDAYKTALDANFMQIDEVRYAEDLEPLGLEWIKIGLQDVLYDPKTKMVYTPNTNQFSTLSETSLQERAEDDILEERGYIRGAHGWFEGSDDGNRGGGNGGGKAGTSKGVVETGPDPSGENIFEVKGFRNRQALMNHWENGRTHKEEYIKDGIDTAEKYEKRAVQLIESKTGNGILGHCDKNGAVIRYDKKTNDFVKGHPQKGVFTMFKPNDGIKYYKDQLRKDISHGGKA